MDWLQQLYDLFGTTYEYPYTDYQQINLDFVFSALVSLKNAIVGLQGEITETSQSLQQAIEDEAQAREEAIEGEAQAREEAIEQAIEGEAQAREEAIEQAIEGTNFQLVASVTSVGDNTEFNIPLSKPCQEIYMHVETIVYSTSANCYVEGISNGVVATRHNAQLISSISNRWYFCHMLALHQFAIMQYTTPSATSSGVPSSFFNILQFIIENDEYSGLFDSVHIHRYDGTGVFRPGTIIRIYGR